MAYLLLLTGLTISAVAIYYSVVGLAAIFSAAIIPIIIMGTTLEVAKLVCATWLKANWNRAPLLMKSYMTTAVVVLMVITSMGIFGFLSKAHNDQNLVSGDVQSKIAIYDEKIKTEKENIDAARKALAQMDASVDQTLSRSTSEQGADKATAIRRSQAKERANLQKEITTAQANIVKLQDERAPIAAEVRKVEAEVGPIKYIAKFVYGDNPDANILEKAVTWVIILIVVVFDPLAVIMLLAAQMTFQWKKQDEDPSEEYFQGIADDINEVFGQELAEAETIATKPVFNEIPDWEDPWEGKLPAGHTYRGRSVEEAMKQIDEEIAAEQANAKVAEAIDEMDPDPYDLADYEYVDDEPERAEQANALVAEIPKEETFEVFEEPAEEYTEDDYDEMNVSITHTSDGIVIEDAAGTQEIAVEHDPTVLERPGDHLISPTYVQNEEQSESNVWTRIANHTLTEEEYLKKLQEKKGE